MKRILSILVTLVAVGISLQAREVKGSVRCGIWPLKNVVVTDGANFTKTKCFGRFKFEIADEARMVYIITPRGYVADFSSGAPEFYQFAEGKNKFVFKLNKISKSGDYTLFSVSDPQMKTEEQFEIFADKPLKDLVEQAAKYSAEGTTVGVALGDIGWDAMPLQDMYKDAIRATNIPFYSVIGNHDFQRHAPEGPETYREYEDKFGPLNWAAWVGEDLLIGLNDIIYRTNKKYDEGYSEKELTFVRNLLEYIPEDTHIYIAQHSPIYFWWSGKFIVEGQTMIDILGDRKVDFLSGHTHIMNNLIINDNIFDHNAPSLCASWWDSIWCHDGSPRGYEIFKKRNGELTWFLHPVDYPEDMIATLIKKGESRYNPDFYVLNVWDYDPAWKITWWQDGQEMKEITPTQDVEPIYFDEMKAVFGDGVIPPFKRPRKNTHYFTIDPAPGTKVLKVEVVSRFGEVWQTEVEIEND